MLGKGAGNEEDSFAVTVHRSFAWDTCFGNQVALRKVHKFCRQGFAKGERRLEMSEDNRKGEQNMDTVIINGVEYVRKQQMADNYVIIRTYSAGVHAGELVRRNGKEVELKNARRIWYWEGAATLSQLAVDGTSLPSKCKFPCEVSSIILTEAIEIIPCTEKAMKSIKEVKTWEQ